MSTSILHLPRRRVLSIMAAGASLPLLGRGARAGAAEPFRWQGVVLGAEADLTIYAADRDQAAEAIAASLDEVARLEAIFSLHRPDSSLSTLNCAGRLDAPPLELVELLAQALAIAEASGGRFDPTVQPLWRLIADHFAAPGADPAGPAPAALTAARALVGHDAVSVTPREIDFARPGMAVTLNGIAQGYISDRVGALLAARGFRNALVNLGEALAIDRRGDGAAWRIGVSAPDDHARMVRQVELTGGAVATSSGHGLMFEPSGRFNHIVDPERLACADPASSITILAPTAATADGLSTLGALLPDPARDLPPFLQRFEARALLIDRAQPGGIWLG